MVRPKTGFNQTEYQKEWQKKNPNYMKEYIKQYRETHPEYREKEKFRRKKWLDEHREEYNAKQKAGITKRMKAVKIEWFLKGIATGILIIAFGTVLLIIIGGY